MIDLFATNSNNQFRSVSVLPSELIKACPFLLTAPQTHPWILESEMLVYPFSEYKVLSVVSFSGDKSVVLHFTVSVFLRSAPLQGSIDTRYSTANYPSKEVFLT
jgi:hypothetical protein